MWVVAELMSDIILVIWPSIMLYKIKLSRPKYKPLVMISLCCSIFTSPFILVIVILNCGPFIQDEAYFVIVTMLAHITVSFD